MGQIIAIYNFKGGVGKTTSAYIIANLLSRNKKVLLIDADPQCNLSSVLDSKKDKAYASGNDLFKYLVNIIHHREENLNFNQLHDNFHYLPGNYDMIELESNSRFIEFGDSIMNKFLDSLKRKYDIIIFDCPSYFGKTVKYILYNVDHIIMPMTPDLYSIKGLMTMIKKIKKNISSKPLLFAGAFFTHYRSDFTYHRRIKKLSDRIFKSLFLRQTVRNSVSVNQLVESRNLEMNENSNKVLEDYMNLVRQLEKRLQKIEKVKSAKKVVAESIG